MIEENVKAEFLEKHLRFFIEYNSFMVLHFSILYWHLDDIQVLKSVLSSDVIKENKDPIEWSKSREKVFFVLYKHLRLVRSEKIGNWLAKSFPQMEYQYVNDNSLFLFSCIDSGSKMVKESMIKEYKNLELMMAKY